LHFFNNYERSPPEQYSVIIYILAYFLSINLIIIFIYGNTFHNISLCEDDLTLLKYLLHLLIIVFLFQSLFHNAILYMIRPSYHSSFALYKLFRKNPFLIRIIFHIILPFEFKLYYKGTV